MKMDIGQLISDVDAQLNQLVGKRALLVALRDAGATIEVPEQPAQAGETKEPDA